MPACNGCGYCCRKAPCALAVHIYQMPRERCPELVYHDGRWWCRAVENARGPLRDEYMNAVAIGGGCSSSLFNQDRDHIPTPEEVDRRERGKVEPIDFEKLFRVVCRGLGQPFMMSGDSLWLIAHQVKRMMGVREAEAFLLAVREHRDRKTEDFMGEVPPLAKTGDRA